MVDIISDDKHIESLISKTIKAIVRHGGFVSPNLQIHSQKGSISIHSNLAKTNSETILHIPDSCLPSCDDFEFILNGNDIEIKALGNKVNKTRQEMMYLVIDIFNASKKIEKHYKNGFKYNLYNKNPEAYMLIKAVESAIAFSEIGEYNVIKDFITTRALGFQSQDKPQKSQTLMPIVDWMNHNHLAEPYYMYQEKKSIALRILHSQTLKNSSECFVSYGLWDPLALLAKMDYFDELTPFVQSIPVEITLPNDIKLWIFRNFTETMQHNVHTQGLGDYFPSLSKESKNTYCLSHIFIPGKNRIRSLRRVLELIIRDIISANQFSAAKEIERIEDIILTKNREYYEILLKTARTGEESEAASALIKACIRCLQIIDDYKIFIGAYPITYLSYNS
jgi:hypothetical protein